MEYTNGPRYRNGLGAYRLPNVPLSPNNLIETTKSPDANEKSLSVSLKRVGSLRPQTLDGYAKTSGPTSRLATEYASLQNKTGNRDKALAKDAWLDNKPKPKRLPSIRLVKCMERDKKYSLVEILKAQGFENGVKPNKNDILAARQLLAQRKQNKI